MITALLPRMSAHAAERRYSLVRGDFSTGVRLSSVIVVPAALLLIVLGAPLAEFLYRARQHLRGGGAYIGEVFGVFSLGLVPYMVSHCCCACSTPCTTAGRPCSWAWRSWPRTSWPASGADLAPAGHVVEGLGVAFGLANVVGAVVSWWILSRRLGGLAGDQIAGTWAG